MSFQQPAAPLSAGSAALSYSTAGHGSIPQGDFEGGVPAVSATGGSDSTNMDQKIRANIQTIRTNLLAIQENLGNLNRRFVSRRIVESLHDRLRETYDVVLATERLFKAWQVEQQKQPMDTLERQRIRFLYDKLSDHFQEEIKKVHEISERVREAAERVADSNSSPGSGSANTLTTPCGPPSSSASSPSRDRHSPSERSVLNMDASGSGIQEDTRSSSTLSNRGWRVAATTNTGPGGGGDQGGSSSRLQGQGGLRGTELSKPGGGVVHRGNHHGDGLVLDLENVTMLGEDDRDEFFIGDDDEQEMCNEMEEVAEHDSLLQRTVADERHKGLQRIHGQVKQANQIFKDLAQLVLQQGSSIESIESQMQSAHSQIKGAASELYKAHQVQRRSRQRRCLVLFLVFAVISFLFYFYSSVSTVHQRAEDTPQVALSLNPPSSSEPGEKSSQDGSSAESSSLEGRSSPNASSPTDQQDSLGSRFSVGSAIGRVIEAAPMSAGGPRVVLPGGVGVLSRTFKPHPPN